MTDVVSPATRSRMMSAIRGANTRPEINVRKALHKAGYRFRLHRRDLPGTPDIVLPKYRTCIFVHGCFWHRHAGCRLTTTPATRQEFWQAKFAGNKARDRDAQRRLVDQGWRVIVVWGVPPANLHELTI
ncbi:MAG: very short patch repair endonuclease [Burkholderiaceae bacterium]